MCVCVCVLCVFVIVCTFRTLYAEVYGQSSEKRDFLNLTLRYVTSNVYAPRPYFKNHLT